MIERIKPDEPSSAAGGDQELTGGTAGAVEYESHRHGREPGIGVQQGDHRRHVGSPDGDDQHHAEHQRQRDDQRQQHPPGRINHQQHAGRNRQGQHRQVDRNFGPCRVIGRVGMISVNLPAAIKLPVNVRKPRMTSATRAPTPNLVTCSMTGNPDIILRGPDQPGRQTTEGVRQGGSLRNGRQWNQRQRNPQDEPEAHSDADPVVDLDFGKQQRAADGGDHGNDAGEGAPPRRARVTHPQQREDEQRRGNEINRLDNVVHVHDLAGSRFLNILSIRSVSRKPLTIFVIEAKTATAPRIVGNAPPVPAPVPAPASMIEPTTAIAEMALVSDISGVCKSRDTFRITSNPVNVANMNTYTSVRKSVFAACSTACCARLASGENRVTSLPIRRSMNQVTSFGWGVRG